MYNFQKLKQVVDVRNGYPKDRPYRDYGVEVKTDIAIHHSLTKSGNSKAFGTYHHYTNGWYGGLAYHFVILTDGTIEWGNELGAKSYHVGNANKYSLGICLVGDFRYGEPTEEQKNSLYELHQALVKDLPNYERTLGHSDYPQYSWKKCPEFDYKSVIFGGDNTVAKEQAKEIEAEHFVVNIVDKGDTFYSIAKEHGMKVDELKALNEHIDPKKLEIGAMIKIKPIEVETKKEEPKKKEVEEIGIVTVKVNLNCRTKAGVHGEKIKVLPKGSKWKVYAIANNGWLEVGKDQWISGKDDYVEFERTDAIGELKILVPVLNCRDKPNLDGKILSTLKQGQTFKVFEEKNGWLRVSKNGWVSGKSKYVKYQQN